MPPTNDVRDQFFRRDVRGSDNAAEILLTRGFENFAEVLQDQRAGLSHALDQRFLQFRPHAARLPKTDLASRQNRSSTFSEHEPYALE